MALLEPQQLLIAAQAGDAKAFDRLIESCRPVITGYLKKRVPYEEAENLAQETFLTVYEKLPTFRGECPFDKWVMRIALHKLIDYYRLRARQVPTLSLEPELEDCYASVQRTDDNERLNHVEERIWVEQVLQMAKQVCHPTEYTVLAMYYQCESFDEVAMILSMPAATVRSHFLRGRSALLAHLIECAPDFVGGQKAIECAIERLKAETDPAQRLSEREQQALGAPRKWRKAFRAACVKIARQLTGPLLVWLWFGVEIYEWFRAVNTH